MLGKRPRPLQRTNSKSQLMPEGSSSIAHKPCTPVFGAPRQVIGFNPVCKDDDTGGGSPRSVLEAKSISGVGSANLQEKQARSPRSGLESLLSASRPWEKRGSEGVGLGIVAALHTSEGDATKARAVVEVAKGVMANFGAASAHGMLANAFQQPQLHSPKQSQPIPITQVVHSSPRGGNGVHCCRPIGDDTDNSLADSFSWKGLGSLSNQEHGKSSGREKHGKSSGRGAIMDMELDRRESIFSTTSPASSCNENSCLLPVIDFLNACYFCKRRLGPGKDIYMYRGDRAFCSVDCRYQQIVIDERKERCPALSMKASTPFPSASHTHRGRVIAAAAN